MEVDFLAKPEWGVKRSCLSCGARFYDLRHQPIVCPKCGAESHPELALRARRVRAAPEKPAPVKPAVPAAPATEEEVVEAAAVKTDDDAKLDDDDDDSEVIEDTSELGGDDDVVPVRPGAVDEEKTAD